MADRYVHGATLDPARASDAETLVRIVGRHRRRIRFMALVSYAGTGAAIAMAGVSMGLVPTGTSIRVAFVAAAIGVAVAIAWLRTPDVRATGLQLDRRLALADHVVAALDLRARPSEVAPLVLRGAIDRVAAAVPRQVFPFRLPWHTRAALAVALMAVVWGIVVQPSASGRASERGGSLLQAVLEPPPGSPVPEDAVVASADQAAPGGVPLADAAATVEKGSTPSGSQDPVEDRPATAAAEGNRDALAGSRDGGAGGDARGAAGREASDPRVQVPEAGGEARGAGGRGGRGDEISGAPGGGAGPNGGDSGADTIAVASGGVSGAPSSSLDARAAARGASGSADGREEAWRRAEAALASGAVPPRLREYVRAYFNAIREP